MSEDAKKSDNKMIIIGAVVAIVVIVGVGLYYNSQKKETVSLSIGDKKISATLNK